MRTSEKNIQDFITTTNCQFISGYCKDVDFIASTAFELLYFDLLQKYKSIKKIDSEIFNLSPQLADSKLRFAMYYSFFENKLTVSTSIKTGVM